MPKVTTVYKNGMTYKVTSYSRTEKLAMWFKKTFTWKRKRGTHESAHKQ